MKPARGIDAENRANEIKIYAEDYGVARQDNYPANEHCIGCLAEHHIKEAAQAAREERDLAVAEAVLVEVCRVLDNYKTPRSQQTRSIALLVRIRCAIRALNLNAIVKAIR